MMPMRSTRLLFVLAGTLWILAGCAPSQPLPLYVSLQATGDYGYFEEQLSDRRFRVGYDVPIETRYRGSEAERRREVDRKIAVAYDMALLRAAQLARMQGFEVFSISGRENNVRIEERDEYYGSPFLFHHPYWHHSYFAVPYHAFPRYMDRVTEIAVSVDFVAELGADAAADDTFDARDVIARLSRKYSVLPGAAG